jgi:hypothetical protein
MLWKCADVSIGGARVVQLFCGTKMSSQVMAARNTRQVHASLNGARA